MWGRKRPSSGNRFPNLCPPPLPLICVQEEGILKLQTVRVQGGQTIQQIRATLSKECDALYGPVFAKHFMAVQVGG